jgi:hypothetical protein
MSKNDKINAGVRKQKMTTGLKAKAAASNPGTPWRD